MAAFFRDLKFGWRMLVKSLVFTGVAVLAIALGVAANASIFSFVDAVIIRPLPYPHPRQIVGLGQWRILRGQYVQAGVSAPNILDIAKQNRVFQQVGYYLFNSYNLTSGNPPERLEGARLSPGMLKLLGIQPAIGRGFTRDDAEPGRDQVVILGYELWQRQFEGRRDVIGKAIQLDGAPYTIIGVMPRHFYFIWDAVLDVMTPFALAPGRRSEAGRASRDLQTMARLKPGVSMNQAQKEMDTIAARLAAQYPDADKGWGIKVEPLHAAYHRHIAMPLAVISSAAFLVLLIACVNVANLLLVRSTARRKEIAVRMAMGAGRARLVAQLITESALLGFIGGLAGVLFSWVGVRLLALGCARYFPVIGSQWIAMNSGVLAFCLGLAILSGVIFGLAPALQAFKMDLNEPLKESGLSVTTEAARHRLRNSLVVSEVSLAMVLMVGAGLLMRTFVNILRVDPGFDPHHVLEVGLSLPRYKYPAPARQALFMQSALDGLRSLPGVEAAGGFMWADQMLFNLEGHPPFSGEQAPNAEVWAVSPHFLESMRIPLLSGRDITQADDQNAPRVALIHQPLAHRYFPNVNPIGLRIVPVTQVFGQQSSAAGQPLEIAGVVKDVRMGDARQNVSQVFVPFSQQPQPAMIFILRTLTPPLDSVAAVRSAVKSLDSELPLQRVRTLEEEQSRYYGSVRFPYAIVWIFAGLALLLAAVGIYGMISYSVSQRNHEMAIRMALGAERRDVLRLVMTEGLRLTGLGLAIGAVVSVALGRLIQSALFGVRPYDVVTLAGAMLGMAAGAMLACYIPARRATKVDPMAALRHE